LWWPKSHTVTGNPAAIVFEPFVGGRIFERSVDGVEHVWGRITAWVEPRLVEFSWHLFFDESAATKVSITFDEVSRHTHVRLENSGFAALEEAGQVRRERTGSAWSQITEAFVGACDATVGSD